MRYLVSIFIVMVMFCTAFAKKTEKAPKEDKNSNITLYMYGVSMSFTDTIRYVTDIQKVDSAYLYNKSFLGGANEYAAQMSAYFQEKVGDKRVNAVFFAKTRKDAEKKYLKLKNKYVKHGVAFQPLPVADFSFKAVRQE